jgi:3'-5' exonuclease
MTPILVFDIETIPDTAAIRTLWNVSATISDAGVAELAQQRRRQATGSDFLQHHLHRVVAISCAMRSDDGLRIWSVGKPEDDEATLVTRFFDGIEKFTPQLISWNGSGFDLPVLHYRAMIHGVTAARYFDLGEDDKDFKYNNYINRFHTRHLDLMDLLAMYTGRANAPLDELAKLCGFPGKLGMDGSKVHQAFMEGRIGEIRAYCETDVANTLLLYTRFQKLRGWMSQTAYDNEIAVIKEWCQAQAQTHWQDFVAAWGKH